MRFYELDNRKYISVTSLIDLRYPFNPEFFNKWCESQGKDPKDVLDKSIRIGQTVDDLIVNRFYGCTVFDPVLREDTKNYLIGIEKFMSDYKVQDVQFKVFCSEYGYAGTSDLLASKDGKLYLCDAKTYGAHKGKYRRDSVKIKKVTMQLNMYRYALEKDVDGMLAIIFLPDGGYVEEIIKNDTTWQDWLKEYLENEQL